MEADTTEMTNNETDEIEVQAAQKMLDGFLHKLVAKRIKNGRVTKDTIMGLRVQGLHATITQFHKFTVVELIFAGCRYHGLASMHIGDEPNDLTGIGLAYSRAFDQLLAKHQKNTKRSQQSTILGRIELTIARN